MVDHAEPRQRVAVSDERRGLRRRATSVAALFDGRVGGRPLAIFTVSHMVAGVADAFVTVSLAGSLFFNVSPQASRNQVLLYLVVTMAPFAVLAPLVGPVVDRLRGTRRLLVVGAYLLRGVCAISLAFALFDVTFYVLALAMLITSKASGVVRQALVPRLVDDPDLLVSANASIARLGTIAAGVAGGSGALILANLSARWLLAFAAMIFGIAAIIGMGVRTTAREHEVTGEVEYVQLHLPAIVYASGGLLALRGAVGYFVFMLAFSLRRSSEPPVVYGTAVLLYGIGTFLGNVIAPRLRRRFHEERLLAGSLIAPAVATAIGLLGVSRPLIMTIALVVGVSATIARVGFDSLLQRSAPEAMTGRAFARYEWRFQLAWVFGAAVATAITLPVEAAMGLLAVVLGPAAILYMRAARIALRFHPSEEVDPLSAALSRFATALAWRHADAPRHAVIDAISAVDLARGSGEAIADEQVLVSLDQLRRAAVDPAATVDDDTAREAIRLAAGVLGVLPDGSEPFVDLEGDASGGELDLAHVGSGDGAAAPAAAGDGVGTTADEPGTTADSASRPGPTS
jgi:predicted MFS family arabinose efflux permease